MKNLSLSLMVLTTLFLNISAAGAVNKQIENSANNEVRSQQSKITNSTNIKCYWVPAGFPMCK